MDNRTEHDAAQATIKSMRPAYALPEPLPKGPFAVADALELGVSRSRLRARDLRRPYWGLRIPSLDDPRFADYLASARLVMRPDEVFSHLTAARMLALPLPEPWSAAEPVHITGPTTDPRRRRRGIVAHRGLEIRSMVAVGVDRTCTDAVTTWADLAMTLSVDDLVVLGDAIVRRAGGIQVASLSAMAASRRGHRGAVGLRTAASLVRVGSDSPMETLARLLFVRGGLPEPELNVPILDASGGWLATGDLVWKMQRVVGEFDGDHHRTDRRQWQVDVARRESVVDAGWTYVQLTARSVTDPVWAERTLRRMRRLLLPSGHDWLPPCTRY